MTIEQYDEKWFVLGFLVGPILFVILAVGFSSLAPKSRAIIQVDDYKVYCYRMSENRCGMTLRKCTDGVDRACATNVLYEEYEK